MFRASIEVHESRFVEGEGWTERSHSNGWDQGDYGSLEEMFEGVKSTLEFECEYDVEDFKPEHFEKNRFDTSVSKPDPERGEDVLVDVFIWVEQIKPFDPKNKPLVGDEDAPAEIIAEKPYSNLDSNSHLRVVLADRGERDYEYDRYVTWEYNTQLESYDSGDYFYTFAEALKGFNERGSIIDN